MTEENIIEYYNSLSEEEKCIAFIRMVCGLDMLEILRYSKDRKEIYWETTGDVLGKEEW